MKIKFAFKKLVSPLFKGAAFGFGLLLVVGIAFAFSTWAPGQPPQGNPANGNVQLAACPSCPDGYYLNTVTNKCVQADISGHSYGYCSSTSSQSCCPGGGPRGTGSTCRGSASCDSNSLTAPAICTGLAADTCGCPADYTLKLTGTSNGGDGGYCWTSWTTSYYTCVKN